MVAMNNAANTPAARDENRSNKFYRIDIGEKQAAIVSRLE